MLLSFFACERFLKTTNGPPSAPRPSVRSSVQLATALKRRVSRSPRSAAFSYGLMSEKLKPVIHCPFAIRPITPDVYDRPLKAGLAGGGRASVFRMSSVCPVQNSFPYHCHWFRPGRGRRGLHVSVNAAIKYTINPIVIIQNSLFIIYKYIY